MDEDKRSNEPELNSDKNSVVPDVELERREREIQRKLEKFERDAKRSFEKHILTQKRSYESMLRNEMPKSRVKNRQIVFCVIDTGIQFPIWQFHFAVDNHFNSFDLAIEYDKAIQNYLNSAQFLETQKKIYYRMKKNGVDPTEIYHLIEPRYASMDRSTKKRFRNTLTKYFARQTTPKRGDKKGKMSPRLKG